MGLPRAHRLKDRRDFRNVYRQGITRQSPHLRLKAVRVKVLSLEQKEIASTRLGISISRKVSKKAVTRNRIKRLIRAALRELLPNIVPGWNIVLTVKPEAIGCEYEHFLRELKQLLKKAEILNGY